jgi:hypothetical protein
VRIRTKTDRRSRNVGGDFADLPFDFAMLQFYKHIYLV